ATSLIAALVLAGGLSRRMGRAKLLLDVRGRPVIRRTVEALLAHVADVVVVTGTEDAALRAALAELPVRFVNNPRPQDGQGSSIAVGVGALKRSEEHTSELQSRGHLVCRLLLEK